MPSGPRLPTSKGGRFPSAGILGIVLTLLLSVGFVLWIGPGTLIRIVTDRNFLEAFLRAKGAWGPAILAGLQALQVILAPIPGHVLGVISGFLFGVWKGTLFTALGVGVGSAFVLFFARRFGRPLVSRWVSPAAVARIDQWAARRGPLFFALVLLVPFVPDDLACFAVGLSRLPLLPMLGLIVLARLPGHFVAAWAGAQARDVPAWLWAILGIVALALFLAYWRHREAIEAWLLSKLGTEDRENR